MRKSFLENYQNRWQVSYGYQIFTNFPASTGFLVMVRKELPFLIAGKLQRVVNKMRY